jgi:hypothetical protein
MFDSRQEVLAIFKESARPPWLPRQSAQGRRHAPGNNDAPI